MITVRIKGGLGNQLFQYAVGYAMHRELNQPLQFNPAFNKTMTARKLGFLDLHVDDRQIVDTKDLPWQIGFMHNRYVNKGMRILKLSKHHFQDYVYFLEPQGRYYPEFFDIQSLNIYLDGYYQTEKYFVKYRADLLRQFRQNYVLDEEYMTVLERVLGCNSVAVHIRRGDFRNNRHHFVLPTEYYLNSIKYIRKHIKEPEFFFFSDDMPWVRENFGEQKNFHYIALNTQHSEIDEMMLMKNCHHIIAANSTFSWWAAWLNEHDDVIKIVPNKHYGNSELIPDNWIKMEMNGVNI